MCETALWPSLFFSQEEARLKKEEEEKAAAAEYAKWKDMFSVEEGGEEGGEAEADEGRLQRFVEYIIVGEGGARQLSQRRAW